MNELSKLLPAHVEDACDTTISSLTSDNNNLTSTQEALSRFCDDSKLSGDAYKSLKNQVKDYEKVIYLIQLANDMDIDDCNRLKNAIPDGTEDLIGIEILNSQAEEQRKEREYLDLASENTRKAVQCAGIPIFGVHLQEYYNNLAHGYIESARTAQEMYQVYKKKRNYIIR